MRPRSLSITAFGPFPDTVTIDFAGLADVGLFVVTGPTGSGKSTIFDAMVYALYGTVPGSRDAKRLRSDHCAPDATPRVELNFEAGGDRYLVSRVPTHTRPKRRGDGQTEVPAEASLHRVVADRAIPLASGMREVTEAVTALVGLDDAQFQRVVLLPQGDFDRFLDAKSDERRPLLRQLFGSHVHDRITDELKQRSSVAASAREETRIIVDQRTKSIDECIGRAELLAAVEPPADGVAVDRGVRLGACAVVRDVRQQELAGLRSSHTEAATTLGRLDDQLRRWQQREALIDELRRLEASTGERAAEEARLEAARRAAPVTSIADERSAISDRLIVQRARRDLRTVEVGEQLGKLGVRHDETLDLGSLLTAIERQRTAVVAAEALVAEVARADALAAMERAGAAALSSQLEALRGEDGMLRAQEAEALAECTVLEPLARRLSEAELEFERAQADLDRRIALIEWEATLAEHVSGAETAGTRYEAAVRQFLRTAAPRLAAELVEGEPCPVCGSPDHPRPAEPASGGAIDEGTLDELRDLRDERSARRDATMAEVSVRRSALGDLAGAALDVLTDRVTLASGAAAAAVEADRAWRIAVERQHAARARLDELALVIPDLAGRSGAATASAELALIEHGRLSVQLADLGERATDVAAWRCDIDDLVGRVEALAEASRQVEQFEVELGLVDRQLAEAVALSGFGDVASARQAAIAPDDLATRQGVVAAAERRIVEARAAIAALDDLPDEQPEVGDLRDVVTRLQQQVERLEPVVEQLRAEITSAERALGELADDLNRFVAATRAAEVAATAYRRCAGQLAPKVSLESWVLASELERVVAAANTHLASMTAGRYQLLRSDDVSDGRSAGGLDLEVDDAHTGRRRRPGSLSGGERFQASLALALGLADVVTSGTASTSRTLDALFVDEGFGSLDPQALDQAIDTLDRLRGHGRQIGVITHVEAMKAALQVGVEVVRLADNRGSTIRQPLLA